ncbi:putative membrane-bound metal-dependent hydrolase [Peptacetobacter hiranonis DSM 13275]|uniref:Putative membrane-bound metal-dependent hydrolase n=2 Tax=Clostridia TaxID=186801 RepID=B6FZA1_PEPHT|nr:putative membrane-bound metal-dependent hydrolase [Peptacetobacter hiranonis DSM 13275]
MRKSLITATLLLLALVLIISKVDISFVIPILVFSVFPWLKHRNFSHSILMVLIVYIIMNPLGEFFNYDSLGLMASSMYLLHIICDMFTKRGVAIFYPFSKNMISVGYIRVGGRFSNIIENLLVFVLILFTIYLVFKFV